MRLMTWEQKLEAMIALLRFGGDASLHMRAPSDWYARLSNVEIKRGCMLESVCGNGDSPQTAVENLWVKVTDDLEMDNYLVLNAYDGGGKRRAVRWAGFMWADVQEEKAS